MHCCCYVHNNDLKPPASQNLPDITENVAVSQPLSFAKRYPVDNAYNSRVHKSVSMESSRRWFADLVAEQIQSGRLFEDKQMPANDAFVKRNASPYSREFRWLRPQELTRNPKFIIDGVSRFDVRQGEIGDCWFLAALSSLSMYTDLLENVVPVGQSFETHGAATEKFFPYCGMFWFRFWQFGDWVDVVIDDRLPTRNGHLVFMHSSNRNEYWSALLEKAYAKLLGSYEAMHGGNTSEAMEDFTGGLTEFLELGTYNPLPYLFRIIEKSNERRSLMACSIDASPDQMEADGPFGLVLGHAYSVTDVKRFVHVSKAEGPRQLQLLRLRNPWGNDREWYGPWSDRSNEWNGISASERKRIGLVFEHDGEFWYVQFGPHGQQTECYTLFSFISGSGCRSSA
ncbi:unnamed protein product [Dicrocoelium dendriticum]|nr:unnamed protein product [Dicrocoelium dendriticum]